MCGINGIFGIEKIGSPDTVIGKMNDAIAHRGPDAAGVWKNDQLALGHRRLSIIDLSPAGNQPFISADGKTVIVFNGEIYNYRELKTQLGDFNFRTNSDTEVLLAAWFKWGKECVHRLDGMFAFAIWDNDKQELFIARDRMGVKPLYYSQSGNSFLFSSELRGLLASGLVDGALDEEALTDYLKYQTVHAPTTLLRNVKMLLPGSCMVVTDTEFSIYSYWDAASNTNYDSKGREYTEVVGEVRALLDASVKKRLIADVPFGAFLSGGIDSSAVVGLMAQHSSQPVKTFHISFGEKEFSEAEYARKVADRFSTNHTEILIHPDEFLRDLPAALNALDHPSGDGPNTWVVSRATKQAGVTMALSGIGGDELFAGYDVFRQLHGLSSKQWMQYFPMLLRRPAGSALMALRKGVRSDKLDEFLRLEYFELEYVYPLSRQVLKNKKTAALLGRKQLPVSAVKKILDAGIGSGTAGAGLPGLSRISYAEMYTYLQNVLLRDTDQMSMAHALEVREPFLDHQLISYVMGIRDSYKFPDRPKKLLVDAMGDLLPKAIWDRPKMGFTFPWKHWMKNELRDFCEERINYLSQSPYFNAKELTLLWNAFLNDDPRYPWSRIWHLVVLGHWMQKNAMN